MAAERPFIYDPSQQVAKNIEGVNRSVQNAWQPLIENKIRDYESISNDLANIDEIKRNLKGYHADILTSRLGTLQGDLAKTIEKNGTINVAARAKVKADIEQVKNLYVKSQQAGPMLEEMLSRVKENSAYINDVAGTRVALIRKFSDPKTMLSGQSLSDELEEIYSKGLNVPAVGNARTYNLYKHVEKTKINWTNPATGDLETIEFRPVDGLVFDNATGTLVPDMAKIQANAKGFFTTGEMYALKQNIGAGQALNANVEDAAMGLYLQSLKNVSGFSRIINKTSDQIRTGAAKMIDAENKVSPQSIQEKKDQKTFDNNIKTERLNLSRQGVANSSANLGLSQGRFNLSQDQFVYQQEQDKLTPSKKGKSLFKVTGKSGTVYIPLVADDKDVSVGITLKGNPFLEGKNGSKPIYDPKVVYKVLNTLKPEQQTAIQGLIDERRGGVTPIVSPKTSSVQQKASSEMIQSASGKQISSVDFYKMSAIDRLNWKKK
jgi:hypothetical protein